MSMNDASKYPQKQHSLKISLISIGKKCFGKPLALLYFGGMIIVTIEENANF